MRERKKALWEREKASERARAGHADGSDITLCGGGSEIHGGVGSEAQTVGGNTYTERRNASCWGAEYMTGDTIIAVAHVCVKKNL